MDIKSLVQEKFGEPQPCNRHCDQNATLKFLNDNGIDGAGSFASCYSCPGGYLSKIIVYGDSVDPNKARDYIKRTIGKEPEVTEMSVRIASRYPWDLGLSTGDEKKVMMAAYWTQNYPRPKNDDPNRMAAFLCSNCNNVFSQPLSSKNTLCSSCRT